MNKGERLLSVLEINVISIIKKWSNDNSVGYDGFWFGYSQLIDEINELGYDINFQKEISPIVKQLHKEGFLSYEPTYNSEGQLNGRGYFYRGINE